MLSVLSSCNNIDQSETKVSNENGNEIIYTPSEIENGKSSDSSEIDKNLNNSNKDGDDQIMSDNITNYPREESISNERNQPKDLLKATWTIRTDVASDAEKLGLAINGELTNEFIDIYYVYKAILTKYLYDEIGLNNYANEVLEMGFIRFNEFDFENYIFYIENFIHIERLTENEKNIFLNFVYENNLNSIEQLDIETYFKIIENNTDQLKGIVINTYKNIIAIYSLDYVIEPDHIFYPYIQNNEKYIGYLFEWEPNAGIYDLALSINIRQKESLKTFGDMNGKEYLRTIYLPTVEQKLSENLGINVVIF